VLKTARWRGHYCGANKASRLTVPPPDATWIVGIHMSKIKSICVYCGSGPGTNPAFIEAARRFGLILAENRIRLVYGGGEGRLRGMQRRERGLGVGG